MSGVGLVVTGTRAAGKSTVVAVLVAGTPNLRAVRAVTTRPPRPTEPEDAYDYVSVQLFQDLRQNQDLLVESPYGEYLYGIKATTVELITSANLVPVLTLTPESAIRLVRDQASVRWRGVFLDAPDHTLDQRLIRDGRHGGQQDLNQRLRDRLFANPPLTVVQNLEGALNDTVNFVRQEVQLD